MRPLGLLLLCGAVLLGCGDVAPPLQDAADTPRPAKIAIAQVAAETQIKTFPGVTEAARKAVLAFRVGGQIVEMPVKAGQAVKLGALIARLDDAPYRNTVAERRAAYDLARADLSRQKTLFEQKHIARSKLDIAQSTFDAAQAALQQARDNLTYTRLTAPYDGVVSRIEIEPFQNVPAQQPIVQFQGRKAIDVVFNIPESVLIHFKDRTQRDGHVLVRFDGLPDRTYDAWYREHETLPDLQTRSFQVTVTMPRPDDLLVLPGMSVSVLVDMAKIYAPDATGAGVRVPVEAVFEDTGQTWVWRVDDTGTAHRTAVTALRLDGADVVIGSGLVPGDRVIAAGTSQVTEGQKVRPIVRERGL